MTDPPAGPALPEVGTTVTFAKTVGESDVYGFAGISGDFSPNHIDADYMRRTTYGERIAHGGLLVAYMSTCSTKVMDALGNPPTVSLGYDRIRFVKPVFIGDTVTVTYTVDEIDNTRGRSWARVECTNQHGDVVAAATHVLQSVTGR